MQHFSKIIKSHCYYDPSWVWDFPTFYREFTFISYSFILENKPYIIYSKMTLKYIIYLINIQVEASQMMFLKTPPEVRYFFYSSHYISYCYFQEKDLLLSRRHLYSDAGIFTFYSFLYLIFPDFIKKKCSCSRNAKLNHR